MKIHPTHLPLLCKISLCLCVLPLSPAAQGAEGADIDLIKARILEDIAGQLHIGRADVDRYLSTIQPDGSWPEIDYDSADDFPHRHLFWMNDMAMFHYAHGKDLESEFRELLETSIVSAFDFWMAKDPKSENWWHNRIEVQNYIGPLMLLMEASLTPAQMAAGLDVMQRGGPPSMTGANLAWVTQNYITQGLLTRNPDMLREGFDRMAAEIHISEGDGIQQDFSFHQHGKLPYVGGYGTIFASTVARFAWLADGTRYQFPAERIELLTSLVLDCMRWMIYSGKMDRSMIGRNLTRKNSGGPFDGRILDYLARVDNPRQDEILAWKRHLDSGQTLVEGNRHFWRSDYMVHRRRNYFCSLRLLSDRTTGTEGMNGENLLGYHLAKGIQWILRTGGENLGDFFAVADWRRLPGTTTAQFPIPSRWQENAGRLNWVKSQGRESFVGGVSDGTYGAAVLVFSGEKLLSRDHEFAEDIAEPRFRKAWFFFDEEFVVLGTGITYQGDEPVVSTVNQANLSGVVQTDGAGGTAIDPDGEIRLRAPAWVAHSGMGYVFPGKQLDEVVVRVEERLTDWPGINIWNAADPTPAGIFTVWIDHGIQPRDVTFNYIVLPDGSPDVLVACTENPPVSVLSNTHAIQAVTHSKLKLTQIVFHEPGQLALGDWIVRVDQPCLLLVGGPNREVVAASPVASGKLTVDWFRPGAAAQVGDFAETPQSRMEVALPGGLDLGRSVSAGRTPLGR